MTNFASGGGVQTLLVGGGGGGVQTLLVGGYNKLC